MSNQSIKILPRKIPLILLFLLLNLSFSENIQSLKGQSPPLYPSVLSLQNKGLVVVQKDGIYFYDENEAEIESKKIKFETPISSEKENEKISMTQFPEKEGGYILIHAEEYLYILQSTGNLLKKQYLPEMTMVENIKIIPYKEEQNNLLYIISYQLSLKKFGINLYKFDLINKQNSMITTKTLNMLQNKENILTSNYEIFGSSCLFMKNSGENEDLFTCFFGVGFPSEIQARIFTIKKDLFEEKNSFKYLLGKYEIETFSLISAIPNEKNEAAIIYYYKNKILSKIDFDFIKGFSEPNTAMNNVNLYDEDWKEESEKIGETKESIFSSRLYWIFCKSFMIFYNSNFNLLNKGFISHDNKCSKLLSYSKFFKENNYSLNVDGLKNNQILVQMII